MVKGRKPISKSALKSSIISNKNSTSKNSPSAAKAAAKTTASAVAQTTPNIITLTMIVKNEAKIITRLLDSVLNFVDNIAITDTGSTDNTIQIISDWCLQNNKPFQISSYPFLNFSANRTKSYYLAKKYFPQTTYFLLLDADMTLVLNEKFDKKILLKDFYRVEQITPVSRYYNCRFLKNLATPWRCLSVSHEYWSNKEKIEESFLSAELIHIFDKEDGGSKDDKLVRDERLFREALTDEGRKKFLESLKNDEDFLDLIEAYQDKEIQKALNIRYHYYLGQTLSIMNKQEEAIKYFRLRINMGGFAEEAWYARFRIGMAYGKLADQTEEKIKNLQNYQADRFNCADWLFNYVQNNFPKLTLLAPEGEKYYRKTIEKLEKMKVLYQQSAMESYNLAYQIRPHRIEPLVPMIEYYRKTGNYLYSYKLAVLAKEMPYPKDDLLFVQYHDYGSVKNDWEIALSAYYLEKYFAKGVEACEVVLDAILSEKLTDRENNKFKVREMKYYYNKMKDRKEGKEFCMKYLSAEKFVNKEG